MLRRERLREINSLWRFPVIATVQLHQMSVLTAWLACNGMLAGSLPPAVPRVHGVRFRSCFRLWLTCRLCACGILRSLVDSSFVLCSGIGFWSIMKSSRFLAHRNAETQQNGRDRRRAAHSVVRVVNLWNIPKKVVHDIRHYGVLAAFAEGFRS